MINTISHKDGVWKFYVENIEAGNYTLKIKHDTCTKIKKVTYKGTVAEEEGTTCLDNETDE